MSVARVTRALVRRLDRSSGTPSLPPALLLRHLSHLVAVCLFSRLFFVIFLVSVSSTLDMHQPSTSDANTPSSHRPHTHNLSKHSFQILTSLQNTNFWGSIVSFALGVMLCFYACLPSLEMEEKPRSTAHLRFLTCFN